ncbi:MAG: ABC transporter permease subunit [Actinomycetota bacterium]
MNTAVFRHAMRQAARTGAMLGIGLGLFFFLVMLSSVSFIDQAGNVPGLLAKPPRAMRAFVGGAADFTTPAGWVAVGMFHPVVLALQTAGALLVASNSGASELERGTMDFVLSRPVGRTAMLSAKMAAGLSILMLVVSGGVTGTFVAKAAIPGVRNLPVAHTLIAFGGSWLLFSVFAMFAFAVFATASLRSRALGVAAGTTIGMFFLNFVALLFDGASWMRFFTPFHYFSAANILESRPYATDLGILAGLAVVFAIAAVRVFSRRDLAR